VAGSVEHVAPRTRKIGVFIDYPFLYDTARRCFPPPGVLPTWYGNVDPLSTARAVTRLTPPWIRRSERELTHVAVVLPVVDGANHPVMRERVEGWKRAGVEVAPSPSLPGPAWRVARAVLLTMLVTQALERGDCNLAVVVAGEVGMQPLVQHLLGEQRDEARVELAGWMSSAGELFSPLAAAAPSAWCHRMGPTIFGQLAEKPRPTQRQPSRRRGHAQPTEPDTAMAEAFRSAHRHPAPHPQDESSLSRVSSHEGPSAPNAAPPKEQRARFPWLWRRSRRDSQ
jgi:hypothetical protein